VLADLAVPIAEFDNAWLSGEIKDAQEDVADATDDTRRDKLARRLEQLEALQAALGAAQTAH
jgi:F-type H+-transporting ATPase subunit epsilon